MKSLFTRLEVNLFKTEIEHLIEVKQMYQVMEENFDQSEVQVIHPASVALMARSILMASSEYVDMDYHQREQALLDIYFGALWVAEGLREYKRSLGTYRLLELDHQGLSWSIDLVAQSLKSRQENPLAQKTFNWKGQPGELIFMRIRTMISELASSVHKLPNLFESKVLHDAATLIFIRERHFIPSSTGMYTLAGATALEAYGA